MNIEHTPVSVVYLLGHRCKASFSGKLSKVQKIKSASSSLQIIWQEVGLCIQKDEKSCNILCVTCDHLKPMQHRPSGTWQYLRLYLEAVSLPHVDAQMLQD